MVFPPAVPAVQEALQIYNQEKGTFRRLLVDHPAIRALKKLKGDEQSDCFHICLCFIKNFPPLKPLFQREDRASVRAYRKILHSLVGEDAFKFDRALNALHVHKLLTKNNFTAILNHKSRASVLWVVNLLHLSLDFLTQDNLEAIVGHPAPLVIAEAAQQLYHSDLLNQSNYSILLSRDTMLLLSNWALENVWQRFKNAFTRLSQEIFDQLTRFAQAPEPKNVITNYLDKFFPRSLRTINPPHSTYITSFNESASQSAKKLYKRFKGGAMTCQRVKETFKEMKSYLTGLPNSKKKSAAERCLQRIMGDEYIDRRSAVSLRKLVVLAYKACPTDLRAVVILEALYEIQRGNNLSETGVDLYPDEKDKPICSAGAFNKLIEKLQGIDPGCEIQFMSPETASLKLAVVVREETRFYLQSLAKPETADKLRAFTQLIAQLQEVGCEPIWSHIKDKVTARMFDEFSKIYGSQSDDAFVALINAGIYANLGDLRVFQRDVQSSAGYGQYCSQSLRRQLGMFSLSYNKYTNYLITRRHESVATQQEYDRRFGLVLKM